MDPNENEFGPKVVVKSSWIFEPKNVSVPHDNGGINVQEKDADESISENHFEVAQTYWQWTQDVSQYFEDLNEEDELETSPTTESEKDVEESPLLVAAKLFKPNDAQQNWRTQNDPKN